MPIKLLGNDEQRREFLERFGDDPAAACSWAVQLHTASLPSQYPNGFDDATHAATKAYGIYRFGGLQAVQTNEAIQFGATYTKSNTWTKTATALQTLTHHAVLYSEDSTLTDNTRIAWYKAGVITDIAAFGPRLG